MVTRVGAEMPLRQSEEELGAPGGILQEESLPCVQQTVLSRGPGRGEGDLELQGGFIPSPGQLLKAARQGAAKDKLGRQGWES